MPVEFADMNASRRMIAITTHAVNGISALITMFFFWGALIAENILAYVDTSILCSPNEDLGAIEFYLNACYPTEDFGRQNKRSVVNFMLPKRRFGKTEPTFQKSFSKHFSGV
jgi:hypothetical protein